MTVTTADIYTHSSQWELSQNKKSKLQYLYAVDTHVFCCCLIITINMSHSIMNATILCTIETRFMTTANKHIINKT